MKDYIRQIRNYYDKNGTEVALSNWKLLRKMTLIYAFVLFGDYFLVCVILGIQKYSPAIFIAIILHLIYTAAVYSQKPKKNNKVVNLYLYTFGAMISAAAIIVGTVYSEDNAINVFPLVLILMGQIYSISPFHIYTMNLITSIIFILLSIHYKTEYYVIEDIIQLIIANTITVTCSDTIMRHRLETKVFEIGLQQLSQEDRMTGLYNKVTFEKLYYEFNTNRSRGLSVLAVIDMDGFKQVNDQYGHQVGDRVLITFAELIKNTFSDKKNCILGRFGGDEFIVLLRNQPDIQSIQSTFDQLIVNSNSIGQSKYGFPIKCSIGATAADPLPESFASCFITSDQALYQIKNESGNQCKIIERSHLESKKPSMMIVDDDDMTRELIGSYFRESFQLIEAENGLSALNYIYNEKENISIILMDLEMPVMDGYAVLEKLHEMNKKNGIKQPPVLIVSADTENELNLRDLGVTAMIRKPFQSDEIRRVVEKTLLA